LVAGIGNIFFGDDAFGVEVMRAVSGHQFPPQVRVADFGICSYALAYALTEGYEAAVLVDAVPRGEKPGTLYLLQLAPEELDQLPAVGPDPHSMDPVRVLQLARSLGGIPPALYLLGCEPAPVVCEEGQMGLSAEVQAAVPRAVDRLRSLVSELLLKSTMESDGFARAA
jgi:hydrogenase maturation protease